MPLCLPAPAPSFTRSPICYPNWNGVPLQNPNVSPAKMQPADHMSMDVEYSLAPKRTSGGRYHSVTTWRRPHPQGPPSHLESWKEVQEEAQRAEERRCWGLPPFNFMYHFQAYLSGVAADWDTKGSGQAKISQFQLPILRGDNTKGTWRRAFKWFRIASGFLLPIPLPQCSPPLAPASAFSFPVPRAIPCL